MKINSFRLIACVLIAGFACLCTVSASAQEELFTYNMTRSSMPPDTGPATVAEYEITFNVSALARSERDVIELELPDGSRFVAMPEEIEHRGENSLAWRGRFKGDEGEGHGVITVHQGHIAGRLLLPGRDVIELKPGSQPGEVRLLELDSSLFPEDDVESISEAELQEHSLPISPPLITQTSPPEIALTSPPGSGPMIDVMVVYTPMARQQAGGATQIETQIQTAVDLTNYAYANSEVFQRISLVHVQEVYYNGDQFGASGSTQRSWVRNDAPVAALRNQHNADLVALISGRVPDHCGMAYVMRNPGPRYESNGFSLTQQSCLLGTVTFAHELGHNMGLEHDPANVTNPGNASYPWSFGHYFQLPNGLFVRTIMTYQSPCPGNCQKINHFSNPNVLYEGVPTGIAGERDNARTLNLTANIIAHFRNGGDRLFSTRFGAARAVDSLDCTTADWSSAVNLGPEDAGVQGNTNRRYGGPCGLHVDLTNFDYLVFDHPDNEDSYNVRFYAFLDDATGNIKLFDAKDDSYNEAFSVWFDDGDVTLRVATASGEKNATFSNIESGWHSIHVNWESATSANVEFLVANRNTPNGSEMIVSGNTSANSISRARLGSVNGIAGSGSLDFDDFVSTRITPPERLLQGDANGDGEINSIDYVSVNNEILEAGFADGQPDCNEDGDVNSVDSVCIANIILGG